jgi:hypothetical protein
VRAASGARAAGLQSPFFAFHTFHGFATASNALLALKVAPIDAACSGLGR